MTHTASELSYAVRWPVIAKYFGQVCLIISALTFVPTFTSLLSKEIASAVAFFLVAFITGAIGAVCSRTIAPPHIQQNEAVLISCSTFLFVSVAMTFPFMAFGLDMSDAFFESVSAVTTTGLTTLAGVEKQTSPFLFARAWMQWYGGLGIVVFSVALITQSGVAAKSLTLTSDSEAGPLGGVRLHARRVLIVYIALTLFGFVVIAAHGVGARNALLYTLAAVSTGGFSPQDGNLKQLGGWPVQATVTLVCLSGAFPLSSYFRSYRDGWKTLIRDKQVRAVLISSGIVSLVLFSCLRTGSDRFSVERVKFALLLGASAQTTTGFEVAEVKAMGDSAKLALLWPMLIGGGMGSTAGGIKLLRFLILWQVLRTAIAKASLSRHAVLKPHLFSQPIEQKESEHAMIIVFAFLLLIGVSWFPFVMFGYAPLDSLFEVISACGTVGLSAGVTRPQLPSVLKFVLCVDMLMGRLEVFAWLVALNPSTWFGKQVNES